MARTQREDQEIDPQTEIALYPVSFYVCWEIKMFATVQLYEVYHLLMFCSVGSWYLISTMRTVMGEFHWQSWGEQFAVMHIQKTSLNIQLGGSWSEQMKMRVAILSTQSFWKWFVMILWNVSHYSGHQVSMHSYGITDSIVGHFFMPARLSTNSTHKWIFVSVMQNNFQILAK